MIALILGGARSGKSALAETLAAEIERADPAGSVTYLATGVISDDDMAERVERHRLRRPSTWRTVETVGAALPSTLRSIEGTVLVDALGTWTASFANLDPDVDGLLDTLRNRTGHTILVSDEVGLGVHPSTEIGRRFRDALGVVNQAVSDIADQVVLVIAGRALMLDRPEVTMDRLVAELTSPIPDSAPTRS